MELKVFWLNVPLTLHGLCFFCSFTVLKKKRGGGGTFLILQSPLGTVLIKTQHLVGWADWNEVVLCSVTAPRWGVLVGLAFVYNLPYHSEQASKKNKTLQSFSTKMRALFLMSCVFFPVKKLLVQSHHQDLSPGVPRPGKGATYWGSTCSSLSSQLVLTAASL